MKEYQVNRPGARKNTVVLFSMKSGFLRISNLCASAESLEYKTVRPKEHIFTVLKVYKTAFSQTYFDSMVSLSPFYI